MTISTLEDAVSILEKWFIENKPPKKVLYLHFCPKELQEELGFSQSTFWYAMYKLREEKRVDFYEPRLFSVFNNNSLTNNKKENS